MDVKVRGLQKRYGDRWAVADASFSIERGEVAALLGPNGAGKTTTVEILEGFRKRTAGDVRVLGVDPATGGGALRQRLGIMLQSTSLDPELTVAETVDLFGSFYARRLPSAAVLELVGLAEQAAARAGTLSGGQLRRLDLAVAVVGDPDLIFLDEPTTGFDPAARRQAWDLIDRLRGSGKTILLTTHYLEEAQRLADRVIVLAGGRVVADASPQSLAGRDTGRAIISFRLPPGWSPADLPPAADASWGVESRGEAGGSLDGSGSGGTATLSTGAPTQALRALLAWAERRGVGELPALAVTRPSLEDVYLQLTAQEDEGQAAQRASTPSTAQPVGPPASDLGPRTSDSVEEVSLHG